jgi:hypothetical protein
MHLPQIFLSTCALWTLRTCVASLAGESTCFLEAGLPQALVQVRSRSDKRPWYVYAGKKLMVHPNNVLEMGITAEESDTESEVDDDAAACITGS